MPVDKISYLKLNKEWNWIVGSGIYVDDVKAQVAAMRWQILGGTLLLSLVIMTFAWLVSRRIKKALDKAISVSEMIADGDLTGQIVIDSQDETGHLLKSLKEMNTGLAKIVGEVRSGADSIAIATEQIAAGNTDLSQRTEEQASSLEETASSMEELTSTVRQNADNAQQANQLAISASGVAVKGGDVINKVVSTMKSITDSSRKISDIIGVIDGIAFQTNILALNAAVEAARAGEQGRGFAVVAAEVRSLAQRSAAAAKEIKTLIEDSVNKVQDGSKLVEVAGNTTQEIVTSIKRVTDIMAEISAASLEQSSGIEQVNTAITQMDDVTQQNAALVEQAAAAAESLEEQAQQMVQVVTRFKLEANAQPRKGVSEKKSLRPETLIAKTIAQKGSQPAPKNQKKLDPSSASPAQKATEQDDDWQEF
jgi:methyl-accepting chemotaxis protein